MESKDYYIQYNIGKSKYCLNYHDGEKKHKDGSRFYDIFLTNNKRTLAKFVSGLKKQGYTERMFSIKMIREEEKCKAAEHYEQTTATNLATMYGWGECDIQQQCFKAGVDWADERPKEGLWDANKVVEWILNNYGTYEQIYTDNSGNYCYSDFQIGQFIGNLRKAMEENNDCN